MNCSRRWLAVGLVLWGSTGACTRPDDSEQAAVAQVAQGLTQADCPAGYNVVVGTNNADSLNGTAGSDCLVGLGGNDILHGLGGNDFVIGGNGNDQLFGEDGNDKLYGEAGDDALSGGNNDDIIDGEGGKDTISGGAGNDTIVGGAVGDLINGDDGNDTIHGDGADDTINGGAGADSIWGGDGVDTVHGDAGNDRIFGDDGNDQLFGDIGNDVIDGNANADTIRGGDGDDVIDGDLANDILYGENGEDVLIGGAGTNTSDGGAGTDACTGVSCELPAMTPSGCTLDSQCASPKKCVVDIGLCLGCLADQDNDGVCNSADGCPADPSKSAPGICGCGVSDADSDTDGVANCNDGCPSDHNKTVAGICGCGVSDADSDTDGVANCNDGCPADASKTAPGICGCGVSDADSDSDGVANCNDGCPADATKTAPGGCGCGVPDADSDGDAALDCVDVCPGFNDQQDGDGDGIPDGCDPEVTCTLESSGSAVYSGSIGLSGPEDFAPLAGKTCVAGDVYVSTSSLVDLSGLESLVAIAGRLFIQYTDSLQSVHGLENLRSVGGLLIRNNYQLHDLAGLGALETVAQPEYLIIDQNEMLSGCWVWRIEQQVGQACGGYPGFYSCNGNHGTSSCGELPEGFACVPGAIGPGVFDASLTIGADTQIQTGMPPLSEMGGISCITGDVDIAANSNLAGGEQKLAHLRAIGGSFTIRATALASLTAFNALDSIGGTLTIEDNHLLSSFGLDALAEVGADSGGHRMLVRGNACLPEDEISALELQTNALCGWADISAAHCTGNETEQCDDPAYTCIRGSRAPDVYDGDVYFGPGTGDPYPLAGKTCITGVVRIENSDLVDLTPVSGLRAIDSYLVITYNPALINLHGLEGLESVGGGMFIVHNTQLNNLFALANLTRLGANGLSADPPQVSPLIVLDNNNLPACWVSQLEAQTGETCLYSDGYNPPQPQPCSGNYGEGSCEPPPPGSCTPYSTGPGVYHGNVTLDGYAGNQANLADYAGTTCITGSLNITYTNLTDLHELAGLHGIAGSLQVWGNPDLTSLAGLEDLETVGQGVYLSSNPQLNQLSSLSSLTSTDAQIPPPGGASTLLITDNESLSACWTWLLSEQTGTFCGYEYGGYFSQPCSGNHGTSSCGALPPDFVCTAAATGPGVYHGDLNISSYGMAVEDVVGNFGGLACITGDVNIGETTLTDLSLLSGLRGAGGNIAVWNNMQLTSLHGLEDMTTVGEGVYIGSNPELSSLAALGNLTTIDSAGPGSGLEPLMIYGNESLSACWSWLLEEQTGYGCGYGSPLIPCSGNHGTSSCGAPAPDFVCTTDATGPGVYHGSLEFSGHNNLMPPDMAGFGGLVCVTGSLFIYSTSLTDLHQLSGLQGIGSSLGIWENSGLSSLAGLESLRTIGQGMYLANNDLLSDLTPLANLTTVTADDSAELSAPLQINDNPSLAPCWSWLIEGQTGTQCGYQYPPPGDFNPCSGNLGSGSCGELPPDFDCTPDAVGPGVYHGDVVVSGYPGTTRPDIANYHGVKCITGNLTLGHTSLSDLQDLAGLEGIAGWLEIFDNPSLTSVDGLDDLRQVKQGTGIGGNPALLNLSALSSLDELGSSAPAEDVSPLGIYGNPVLPACWVWSIEQNTGVDCGYPGGNDFYHCTGNYGSESCGELPPGFECVPGATGPGVLDGDLTLNGFPLENRQLADFGGLTCITGDFTINSHAGSTSLSQLSHLQQIGGYFALFSTTDLETVDGLENLSSIGTGLVISSNAALSSLAGLSGLGAFSSENLDNPSLYIFDNPMLPACWAGQLETQTEQQCGYGTPPDPFTSCSGNTGGGTCE